MLNLTPDTLSRLLFDDIPYLKLAQQEHDEYTMSEDLENVTQQEKPVQPTQNAQTTTVSIDKLRDFWFSFC